MSVREGHAGSHQGKSNVKRNSPSVSQFLDELNWNVKKITIFSSHFPPNISFCHWLKTDSLTHITLQKISEEAFEMNYSRKEFYFSLSNHIYLFVGQCNILLSSPEYSNTPLQSIRSSDLLFYSPTPRSAPPGETWLCPPPAPAPPSR